MNTANVILPVFFRREQLVAILDTTYVLQRTVLKCDVLVPRSLRFVLPHTARRQTGELGLLLGLFSGVRLPATSLDARPRWGPGAFRNRGCFPPWEACEAAYQLSRIWM